MDMLEFLVGKEGGEDKGVIGSPLRPSGLPGLGGELSHERARILLAAYNAKASLVGVGITAMQVFGRDVPDQIGQDLKTAFQSIAAVTTGYIDGTVDTKTLKTATKEARAKAVQMRKELKAGKRS